MWKRLMAWLDRFQSRPVYEKKAWSAFADLAQGEPVSPDALVDMRTYRLEERKAACGGADPIRVVAAYAQDELVYDANGKHHKAGPQVYKQMPHHQRINIFGKAYQGDAQTGRIQLQQKLADILIDAAIDLKREKNWTTVVYDGLRTMEAGFVMYANADPQWLADKLLAPPGKSAHNRALAVDWMAEDGYGHEVPMGGHFDHTNMKTNHRDYEGPEVTREMRENRVVRERAMMKAAINRGTVIAPLMEEFWDDRMCGSEKDLWRVIASVARCSGQQPPAEKAQDYATFALQWQELNKTRKLTETFGAKAGRPPLAEQITYHERYKVIYDRELPENRQVVDWQQFEAIAQAEGKAQFTRAVGAQMASATR